MTTQPQLNPTLSELTTTPKDYELDSHKEVITNAVNTRKNTVSMASTRNDSMESTQRNYSFIKYYTICSVYCMYEDPRNSPEGRMGLLVLTIYNADWEIQCNPLARAGLELGAVTIGCCY